MKVDKKKFKEIIQEELKKASPLARKVLRESEIFKNSSSLLPNEWEEFKEEWLEDHRNHKVVLGKTEFGDRFEAIVDKNEEDRAIIKYIPDDTSAKYDMKPARFFDYIR